MRFRHSLFILLAMCSASSVAFGQADPEIVRAFESGFASRADFDRLHRFILASEDESRWRKIPWLNKIAEGMKASKAENKPMFIWAMNGDPLGCV